MIFTLTIMQQRYSTLLFSPICSPFFYASLLFPSILYPLYSHLPHSAIPLSPLISSPLLCATSLQLLVNLDYLFLYRLIVDLCSSRLVSAQCKNSFCVFIVQIKEILLPPFILFYFFDGPKIGDIWTVFLSIFKRTVFALFIIYRKNK